MTSAQADAVPRAGPSGFSGVWGRGPCACPWRLSQIELANVDAYERSHQNRSSVIERISTLQANELWPGYDELTVSEVQAVLGGGDEDRAQQVRAYERAHQNRAGVLEAAERETSNA